MLAKVLSEADEFAAKYAPIVRKKISVQGAERAKHSPTVAPQEVEFFSDSSQEFTDALRKVSPAILSLIKDQFKCDPSALLRGAFKEYNNEKPANISSAQAQIDSTIEDASTIQDLEEIED